MSKGKGSALIERREPRMNPQRRCRHRQGRRSAYAAAKPADTDSDVQPYSDTWSQPVVLTVSAPINPCNCTWINTHVHCTDPGGIKG